tara:strand:- start:7471 stop:7650 length:180 start_codon:yes stop_codon:yes gene_type:complete
MSLKYSNLSFNRNPTHKVGSGLIKEPVPKPSDIFEGFTNRKKSNKKDYKKKGKNRHKKD